jgi:epoxyqueuosine reductase
MLGRMSAIDYSRLAADIRSWGAELGFGAVGIAGVELAADEAHLVNWLEAGFHGEMDYMERHGTKRSRPPDLTPGTVRVIAARMDYAPPGIENAWDMIADDGRAYISRYALGRDYHKILRSRLQKLTDRITEVTGPFGHRVFTDSAPVLEKALARDAGLGWIGKHTLLLSREAGSWFFLGEIYTDLPLPLDEPASAHCGTCTRCIEICPTQAIVAPYKLDARRCISYLTIELRGSIPEDLRPLIGNRVFGCDDCQLVCPWNKFAQIATEPGFAPRHGLDAAQLVDLFAWSEDEFLRRTEGMAIRRTGYEGWLRNIAVALGNARRSDVIVRALEARADDSSAVVREHVAWALAQQASSFRREILRGHVACARDVGTRSRRERRLPLVSAATISRHSGESRNPFCCGVKSKWIPAFAGMTNKWGDVLSQRAHPAGRDARRAQPTSALRRLRNVLAEFPKRRLNERANAQRSTKPAACAISVMLSSELWIRLCALSRRRSTSAA